MPITVYRVTFAAFDTATESLDTAARLACEMILAGETIATITVETYNDEEPDLDVVDTVEYIPAGDKEEQA